MHDTKFWRIVAVVVCVGLFYVGHGLHNRSGDGLPSLVDAAHAGGVAVYNSRGAINDYHLYTTDPSGRSVHVWTAQFHGKPKYIGTAQTDGKFIEPSQNRGDAVVPEPAQKQ
jgi:hypothetical protein